MLLVINVFAGSCACGCSLVNVLARFTEHEWHLRACMTWIRASLGCVHNILKISLTLAFLHVRGSTQYVLCLRDF